MPLRHPCRWVAAIVILFCVALFLYGAATNEAYQWTTYREVPARRTDRPGAVVTLELTVLAMVIGVVLGVRWR